MEVSVVAFSLYFCLCIVGEELSTVENYLKCSRISYRKCENSGRKNCYNISFDQDDRVIDAYIRLSYFELVFCDKEWVPLEILQQGFGVRPMYLKYVKEEIWNIK